MEWGYDDRIVEGIKYDDVTTQIWLIHPRVQSPMAVERAHTHLLLKDPTKCGYVAATAIIASIHVETCRGVIALDT